VRFANGGQLEAVHVTDNGGKLSVELRGATTVRNSSRSSQQDAIAASKGKPRQVIRTIRDRNEILKIAKSSASRNGYQIR
jgi:hypothetical protein